MLSSVLSFYIPIIQILFYNLDYVEVQNSTGIQSDIWAPPSPDFGYFGSQENSGSGNVIEDLYEFLVDMISKNT